MAKVILKRYLQQPSSPITVHLIGGGGTGSQVLTHLARINATLHALDGRMLDVKLWDPDKVTELNRGRQMFAPADVGHYKAEVLIDRINRFYGVDWGYHNGPYNGGCLANIIITCVDVKKVRIDIDKHLKKAKMFDTNAHTQSGNTYFWIDCGNTDKTGNVIVQSSVYDWPSVVDLPGWTNKEDKELPSCSMQEAIEKQDLFVNTWAAITATNWLWQFLRDKQIGWRGAFYNLERMVFRAIPINTEKAEVIHVDEVQALQNGRRAADRAGREESSAAAPKASRRRVRRTDPAAG